MLLHYYLHTYMCGFFILTDIINLIALLKKKINRIDKVENKIED